MNSNQENQNQVQAEYCYKCGGKGRIASKGIGGYVGNLDTCPSCKGSGFIGKDKNYEYYLNKESDGSLRVVEVKSELSNKPKNDQNGEFSNERSSIFRAIIFIFLVVSYGLFLLFYFFFIKEIYVFKVVTIIFIGLILLLIVLNTILFSKFRKFIKEKIFSEPKDYYWAIKQILKEQN